ncbi:MAG: hypothetical protein IJP31_04545 [Lachnospiraceae bacterium]|nr:hypothetical protein [Lachnospiraceae bacterium]
MLNLTYNGESTVHKVEFDIVSSHIISIKGNLPAEAKGFTLTREGEEDNWDYSAYNTIYRQREGEILFSDDGSVYTPVISFQVQAGGELEGEARQAAGRYENLVIPSVRVQENYTFTGWVPEIPTEGEIEENQTFTAQFQYVPTLQEVQEAKVVEMNTIQQEVIAGGVDVILSDGEQYHFSLTTNDQLSIMGSVAADVTTIKGTPWHIADESVHCQYYSAEDMAAISAAAYQWVLYHVTYFRDLRIYIRSLESKEEVGAVTYGMVIPEEYCSEVLKDMYAMQQEATA